MARNSSPAAWQRFVVHGEGGLKLASKHPAPPLKLLVYRNAHSRNGLENVSDAERDKVDAPNLFLKDEAKLGTAMCLVVYPSLTRLVGIPHLLHAMLHAPPGPAARIAELLTSLPALAPLRGSVSTSSRQDLKTFQADVWISADNLVNTHGRATPQSYPAALNTVAGWLWQALQTYTIARSLLLARAVPAPKQPVTAANPAPTSAKRARLTSDGVSTSPAAVQTPHPAPDPLALALAFQVRVVLT
jgi:hypothetical protein